MCTNGEVLSTLENFDEWLEQFHVHNWVYAGSKELYMMKPASHNADNVKEMIKKSVTLQ